MARWMWAGGLSALVVLAWAVYTSQPESSARTRTESNRSGYQSGDCALFVELVSAAETARQLGRSEESVLASYRVNVWSESNERGKGTVVGHLIPGSRAQVVDESASSYRVKSSLDGSMGWVSRIQVASTHWQNVRTKEPCSGEAKSSVKRCEDGSLYVGDDLEKACR